MLSRLGHLGVMDHDERPVLDALADYHRRDYATFRPPATNRAGDRDPSEC